jgi:NADH oxidase (H2O2-forming)
VDLARKAGIEIGELGGIITDCKLHVKKEKGGEYLENVYALGDCVEVIDWVTKRPTLSMLASTGIAQSRIIADNLFGGRNCVFNPCLSPIATAVSDLQIGSIGVRFEIAKKFGIIPITGKRSKFTRVRYYPRRKPLTVKLLFDGERKLIGAQVVSGECVADRLSEYSVAIRKGITAEELLSIERCFEPSLSLHVDATVDAVRDAMKKM